jgi:hypothetical protein
MNCDPCSLYPMYSNFSAIITAISFSIFLLLLAATHQKKLVQNCTQQQILECVKKISSSANPLLTNCIESGEKTMCLPINSTCNADARKSFNTRNSSNANLDYSTKKEDKLVITKRYVSEDITFLRIDKLLFFSGIT